MKLLELEPSRIRPNARQPRVWFEDDALDRLATSIQEVGVLQPLVVRELPGNLTDPDYELVAGERRLRASILVGLETVPVVVRDTVDEDMLREALVENLHRADLLPLELAAAYQELVNEMGGGLEAVAERLGCSRPHVSNTLRLLELSGEVQELLNSGALQAGHARALLGLPVGQRAQLARRVVAEHLTVREVEDLVRELTGRTLREPPPGAVRVDSASDALTAYLGARADVTVRKNQGRITVKFQTLEELERVVNRIISEDDT